MPYSAQESEERVDMSKYITQEQFDEIRQEISALKEKLMVRQVNSNGAK